MKKTIHISESRCRYRETVLSCLSPSSSNNFDFILYLDAIFLIPTYTYFAESQRYYVNNCNYFPILLRRSVNHELFMICLGIVQDPQVLEKMRVLMQGEVFKYEKYFLSFQTYKAESLSYLLQGEHRLYSTYHTKKI